MEELEQHLMKDLKTLLAKYQNSPYEVNIYILLGDCAFYEGKITSAFQNYLKAINKAMDYEREKMSDFIKNRRRNPFK